MNHRPRRPDSLMSQVEQLVQELGPCTVDGLVDALRPHTREQIAAALRQCHKYGRVSMEQQGKWLGKGKGREPATWAPPKPKGQDKPEPARTVVASVFDLWRLN